MDRAPHEVRGRDWLSVAAVAFLAANLLHGFDHVRQHFAGVNAEVLIGGMLITATAVMVVVAVRRDHPRAPLLAVVVGFAAAFLVAGSHLAPHWSVLSDSYVDDISPDIVSWLVVMLEIVAALLMGLVGLWRSRSRSRSRSRPPIPARA